MKYKTALLLTCACMFCCLFSPGTAFAGGTDVTKQCIITVSSGKSAASLTDGIGYLGWTADGPSDYITIRPPADKPVSGLWLSWLKPPGDFTIETKDGDVIYSQTNDECYIQFISIPQDKQSGELLIKSEGLLSLGEIRTFSGDPPDDLRTFDPPAPKCDILIIAAHPDDDILDFGCIVPIYSVNRGYKVQVVFMTNPNRRRVEEGMYGQWMLGNRLTPVFGTFPDKLTDSLKDGEALWEKGAVDEFITAQIRRFKPSVVVTHDLGGEYGHGAHMVSASHTLACVKSSGDAAFYPESAAKYGTWNVAKCYLHLYESDPFVLDEKVTVPSMGGKTALHIARTAYKQHVTQAVFQMDVRITGKTDCRLFGLAYTNVGKDAGANDLMHHIIADSLYAVNPAYYATPAPAVTPTPTNDVHVPASGTSASEFPLYILIALASICLVIVIFILSRRRASR